jgi:hypothetical protein
MSNISPMKKANPLGKRLERPRIGTVSLAGLQYSLE